MPFINANFDDVHEVKAVTPGRYRLMINGCKLGESSERSKLPGAPQFIVTLGNADLPSAPNIQHYLSLPDPRDTPDDSKYKVLRLKRFLTLFGIPYDKGGIDTDKLQMDMLNRDAMCQVEQEEPNEKGAVYNRLVVPKIME